MRIKNNDVSRKEVYDSPLIIRNVITAKLNVSLLIQQILRLETMYKQ